MKHSYTVLRLVTSALILFAGFYVFRLLEPPESRKRPPDPVSYPVVQVTPAQEHNGVISFDVDGVVVPYRQIEIAPQLSGRVVEKSDDCRLGRRIRKGTMLFRIDPTDFELEVRSLTEEVRSAKAEIDELASEMATIQNQVKSMGEQLLIDQRSLSRMSEMMKRSAASASELDTAKRTELASRNEVQKLIDQLSLLKRRQIRLESALALSNANLDKAKLSLKRTEVRSPIDAIIASDTVEQDGYVQTGQTVLVLQDTSQVDVACKLRTNQMNWLWMSQAKPQQATAAITPQEKTQLVSALPSSGQAESMDRGDAFPVTPARIRYQLGGTTYQWKGLVDRYDGAGIDAETRMVPCRINVDEPEWTKRVVTKPMGREIISEYKPTPVDSDYSKLGPDLMTGMFVKAMVDVDPQVPMVKIPQAAIQPGSSVWVISGGVLERKPIRIVTSNDTHAIVGPGEKGLVAGEAIVTSPMANPVEGAKVLTEGSAEHLAQVKAAKERAAAASRRWGGGGGGWNKKGGNRARRPDDGKDNDRNTTGQQNTGTSRSPKWGGPKNTTGRPAKEDAIPTGVAVNKYSDANEKASSGDSK